MATQGIARSGCILGGVALLLVAAGCAKPVKTAPVSLTEAHVAAVQSGVAAQLKDPDSARFGTMQARRSEDTGTVRVCGTVNAKNSYGGYTGAVRFVADLDDGRGTSPPVMKDAAIGSPRRDGDFGVNVLCSVAGL